MCQLRKWDYCTFHTQQSVCAVQLQLQCSAGARRQTERWYGGVCTARKRGIVRRALAECTCKAIPMTKGIDEMQPTQSEYFKARSKETQFFRAMLILSLTLSYLKLPCLLPYRLKVVKTQEHNNCQTTSNENSYLDEALELLTF